MRPNITKAMVALDAATSKSGVVIDSDFLFYASAIAVTTGTAAGTLTIQGSNDAQPLPRDSNGNFVPANWINIPLATVAVAGAGTYIIPKTDVCYAFIRARYTSVSGTGTISVNMKTLGA
jgi:hypothetical protein